jgi:hypothetical protein
MLSSYAYFVRAGSLAVDDDPLRGEQPTADHAVSGE